MRMWNDTSLLAEFVFLWLLGRWLSRSWFLYVLFEKSFPAQDHEGTLLILVLLFQSFISGGFPSKVWLYTVTFCVRHKHYPGYCQFPCTFCWGIYLSPSSLQHPLCCIWSSWAHPGLFSVSTGLLALCYANTPWSETQALYHKSQCWEGKLSLFSKIISHMSFWISLSYLPEVLFGFYTL